MIVMNTGGPGRQRTRPGPRGAAHPGFQEEDAEQSQFGSLHASLLYCARCRTATPARERLLLVLPGGNLYEYLCSRCGAQTGEKTDQGSQDVQIVIP